MSWAISHSAVGSQSMFDWHTHVTCVGHATLLELQTKNQIQGLLPFLPQAVRYWSQFHLTQIDFSLAVETYHVAIWPRTSWPTRLTVLHLQHRWEFCSCRCCHHACVVTTEQQGWVLENMNIGAKLRCRMKEMNKSRASSTMIPAWWQNQHVIFVADLDLNPHHIINHRAGQCTISTYSTAARLSPFFHNQHSPLHRHQIQNFTPSTQIQSRKPWANELYLFWPLIKLHAALPTNEHLTKPFSIGSSAQPAWCWNRHPLV